MERMEEQDEYSMKSKRATTVESFTKELFITINSSGVTAGDIIFGVAHLVVRRAKPSLKRILGR